MKNDKDPISFEPSLIENSLKPKPTKRSPPSKRPQTSKVSSPSPNPPSNKTGLKKGVTFRDASKTDRQKLLKISKEVGVQIEYIDNLRLFQKLYSIVSEGMQSTPESPTLSKVMIEVDKKLEGHKFLKHFTLKSVRYLWIAARTAVPNWESVEKMLDGFIDNDPNKIFEGVLGLAPGGEITTRLYKLLVERIE